MKRGDLYRVCQGSKNDPKEYRVFLIVSRQLLIDSNFSTIKMEKVNNALRIALATG